MKDTFDLRKYLVENKMTENSRRDTRRRLDGTVLTESRQIVREYSGDRQEDAVIDFDELISDGEWLSELGDPDKITLKVLGHTIDIDYESDEEGSCQIDGKPFETCSAGLLDRLADAIAERDYRVVSKEGGESSSLEESTTDPEAIYEDFDETVSDNAFLESVVGDADSITLNVLGHEVYIDYEAEEDGEGCDVDGVYFTDCDPSLIKKLTGALNRGNYKVVEKDGQSLREGRFLGRRTVSEAKKKGIAKPTWDEVKVWVSRYGDAGAAKRIKITYPEFVEKCGSPEKALYTIKPSAIRSMDRHNSKMRDRDEKARERRMGNSGDHSRRDIDDRNNREKNGYDNPMIPSETGHFMGR